MPRGVFFSRLMALRDYPVGCRNWLRIWWNPDFRDGCLTRSHQDAAGFPGDFKPRASQILNADMIGFLIHDLQMAFALHLLELQIRR